MKLINLLIVFVTCSCLLEFPDNAYAADWSATELQYTNGDIRAPSFAGGADAVTDIYTLQHASGWSFGDVFFFIDSLHDNRNDGFNDNDFYSEIYVNFSFTKLIGKPFLEGAIKDIGLLIGFNAADDAKIRKYLPGIRLSWDLPNFAFLNTDFMAYIDDSAGLSNGGAPKETNSYLIDVNWSRPFSIGAQSFSVEGHIEYAGNRRNEFGAPVSYWILAQPQFRWDAGKTFYGKPKQLYLGIEYQYWHNKLGDTHSTDNRPQLLGIWRF